MNDLSPEDQYLLSKGIDPFAEGITQEADDEVMRAILARDEFKRMQYQKLGGGDMYHEMQQPAPNREELEDALLMEMINEGY